jgi:hypothetical protein
LTTGQTPIGKALSGYELAVANTKLSVAANGSFTYSVFNDVNGGGAAKRFIGSGTIEA